MEMAGDAPCSNLEPTARLRTAAIDQLLAAAAGALVHHAQLQLLAAAWAFSVFLSYKPAKKSRETVGLTVTRTCTQQGLNRCVFYNCGAAAYGHITCNEIKKSMLI